MELLFVASVIGSIGCTVFVAYPLVVGGGRDAAARLERYQLMKASRTAKIFDDMFLEVKPAWVAMGYWVTPLAGALIAYFATGNMLVAAAAGGAATLIPGLWLKYARAQRQRAFSNQLVDMLFMLSSSLRAGLSLMQAFEVLETELGVPASQEIGLMMKAHRVGLSFDEALQGMNRRMGSDELNLIVTAILLARSTGGDVTKVIGQLITTIRDKKRINEKVISLTLQGKLQGILMSILPVFFAMSVRSMNPRYFDIMFTDPLGKTLLITAAMLWIVGMLLMFRFSKVEY
jgi:tight adherence protein B